MRTARSVFRFVVLERTLLMRECPFVTRMVLEHPGDCDGVCPDEISFARFSRPPKPIVPGMAIPCEMPFSIFRLDYVDLTRWQESESYYQEGFERLLRGIQAALKNES